MVKRKLKTTALVCLGAVIVFCALLCFNGCTDDKKYDVTIKVKNNLGQEWIFTPDISELSCELEYTGEEMTFGVSHYQLPDHPDFGDQWQTATGYGADVFFKNTLYTDPAGQQDPKVKVVK